MQAGEIGREIASLDTSEGDHMLKGSLTIDGVNNGRFGARGPGNMPKTAVDILASFPARMLSPAEHNAGARMAGAGWQFAVGICEPTAL